MKRFHVHLHVADLSASVAFYSNLFGAEPARIEADYAKWMLDDPRVNFAISTCAAAPGLGHLGIQTDDAAELAAMKATAEAAELTPRDEGETSCCYARSEKHWVTDPQGIAWEHFHTLGDIAVFGDANAPVQAQAKVPAGCCSPVIGATPAASARGKPAGVAIKASNACC
jgi:catechol 2,3-dioxygenase-like lactoylglutathione lyase family enzyme